jgi:hypothetical protein
MRNFNIQFFELSPNTALANAEPTYKIALSPYSHGAQGTKDYSSRGAFASDLKKYLGYSDDAIERFFSDPKKNNAIQGYPLTDEDAACLGWVD